MSDEIGKRDPALPKASVNPRATLLVIVHSPLTLKMKDLAVRLMQSVLGLGHAIPLPFRTKPNTAQARPTPKKIPCLVPGSYLAKLRRLHAPQIHLGKWVFTKSVFAKRTEPNIGKLPTLPLSASESHFGSRFLQ
jgi:hypothetical protein